MARRRIDYPKLVGFLLLVGGALFGGGLLINLTQALQTRDWPTTPALVYDSQLRHTTTHPFDKTRDYYHTTVSYRYQVEEKTFNGTKIYRRDIAYLSKEDAEALRAQFQPGSIHPAAYDPSDPSEAVLISGVPTVVWLLLAPALLFFTMGLSLSGLVGKRRRRPTSHD